jgi:DNA helicase-2/ATP-dependent DNA helicase PcrA
VPSRLVVDFHVHSRFAIGCSRDLTLETLGRAAKAKGIDVLATGDFTHLGWFAELSAGLVETNDGVYRGPAGGRFLLGTEIACVWQSHGRGRRVHVLVLAPGLDDAARLSRAIAGYARLESDGRPAVRLSAEELATVAWSVDEEFVIIPAHVWTPYFGMYGSKSGFDTVEGCFGAAAGGIRVVETGLSSDPAMNWGVRDLSTRAIVSFSDAHSTGSLGREMTILNADPNYGSIRTALLEGRIVETVEFFPEHGKYHLDGHSRCGVRLWPAERSNGDGRCPRCRRPITKGVLHRVEQLLESSPVVRHGGGLVYGPPGRPPFRSLVPLDELVAYAAGSGRTTRRVKETTTALVDEFGSELNILTRVPASEIETVCDRASEKTRLRRTLVTASKPLGPLIAEAIVAVRERRVQIDPGYDGTYGTVTPLIDQR